MTLTDQMFAAASPIWDAQLAHPFVRGIGDGTLDVRRFERWVRQDYIYLKDFARVFAWAVAKADTLEAMGWYAKVLDLTLNTEMELHRSYAARFGISADLLEAEDAWPTTHAYVDFLVRTSAEGSMAELLAVLLPCAWGYAHIAQQLSSTTPPEDQRYADWIAQYASAEFNDAAAWLRAEMNRVGGGLAADRQGRLVELFVLSSRYEWMFWEMCWHGEEWRPTP